MDFKRAKICKSTVDWAARLEELAAVSQRTFPDIRVVKQASWLRSWRMTQKTTENVHRRNGMTEQQRRDRFTTTHDTAMATIEADAEARRKKTERLKAARQAAMRAAR